MLALATAAHGGQNPELILILIATVVVVVFWRSLVKFGIALVVVLIVVLLVTGSTALLHDMRLLFP